MSAKFPSSVELPLSNGVGTVGYKVFDADGELVIPRTTLGVLEQFGGVGYSIYQAYIQVPIGVTSGIVIWDDGSGNAVDKPFFIGQGNAGQVSVGTYVSTLDSDWGGATAESYVSLSAAENLVASYVIDHSDWDDASGQTKDAALRMATRQLDSLVYLGSRVSFKQTLKFPRYFSFPSAFAPSVGRTSVYWNSFASEDGTQFQQKDVQIATAIQANFLVRQGGRDAHAEAMAAGIRQSSESVGPVRDQFTYTGAGAPSPLCTDAIRFINKYRDTKKIYRS
jgi:hypothetical protein